MYHAFRHNISQPYPATFLHAILPYARPNVILNLAPLLTAHTGNWAATTTTTSILYYRPKGNQLVSSSLRKAHRLLAHRLLRSADYDDNNYMRCGNHHSFAFNSQFLFACFLGDHRHRPTAEVLVSNVLGMKLWIRSL